MIVGFTVEQWFSTRIFFILEDILVCPSEGVLLASGGQGCF